MISKVQQESMTGSVIAQVQTIMLKQLEENRHYVRTVAEVVELCDQIIKNLHEFGIDFQNTAAQGYDGASVMPGRYHGVQSLFRKPEPHAIYVQCYCHRLNLVIVDCCSGVPAAARFFTLLQDLHVFISSSISHQNIWNYNTKCVQVFQAES